MLVKYPLKFLVNKTNVVKMCRNNLIYLKTIGVNIRKCYNDKI